MSNQTSILDLIEEGQRRRDAGIKQARDHADAVSPQWSQRAYNLFVAWLGEQRPRKNFKGEDFRIHLELGELIERPPNDRAYGAIMVRAAKVGLIKKVGYTTTVNPKAHKTPCTLWEKI